MPVIGTAGHVDHGKSTLVHGLTGLDPDRWDEEKERGLTIDLGFAWTTLPDGTEVSFVDVPGHERFIKNMLAGTEAIDVALMVVAADEGWMPQSEEHLAVLDLLGVRHGVVAITKTDRVDADLAELAALEIEERLAGTALAGSPLVPVAATKQTGYQDLLEKLVAVTREALSERVDNLRTRLWVDRSFTIAGAGTVVTGTLMDGPVRVGDSLEMWPGGHQVRVRGLQSHEQEQESVPPGTRCAINLAGLERQQVQRGHMLGRPGEWAPSAHILVDVRAARYVEDPLANRGAYHFHIGSGAWPASLRFVEDESLASRAALIRLPEAVPVSAGDRFILRETGRRAVVGGGRVLDPAPSSKRSEVLAGLNRLRQALTTGPDGIATALLNIRRSDKLERLAAHSGGGRPSEATVVKGNAISRARLAGLTAEALQVVEAYQENNPLRAGMPKASLASSLRIEPALFEAMLEESSELRDDGATVATAEFVSAVAAREEDWSKLSEILRGSGLAVPRVKELPIEPELLHAFLREGRLVRVGPDLVYLPDQLEDLTEKVKGIAAPFTVAQFRDELGLSRKYAVPLLEWLDAAGVTERDGDLRTVQAG